MGLKKSENKCFRFYSTVARKVYTKVYNTAPHNKFHMDGNYPHPPSSATAPVVMVGAARSHLDTQNSVGFRWASDPPVAETSTWHTTLLEMDIHEPGEIRSLYPSKRAAANPCLRHPKLSRIPMGEWPACRRNLYMTTHNTSRDGYPRARWNSNPQSQQTRGRKPMP